jgi:hypothetical protein
MIHLFLLGGKMKDGVQDREKNGSKKFLRVLCGFAVKYFQPRNHKITYIESLLIKKPIDT